MRLNGWQRIGIVASIGWAIGVYVVYLVIGPVDWSKYGTFMPNPDSYWLSFRSHWVALALVPIVLGWLVVYALVYLVRWIRAGFKR